MIRLARIIILIGLSPLLVGGCQIGNNLKSSWRQADTVIDYVMQNRVQSSVDRAAVDAIPFATLGFRYGAGPQTIFTLSQNSGERLFWTSQDGTTIVTESGRIVRTSGFSGNLTGGKTSTPDPLRLPHQDGWADLSVLRILDYQEDFGFNHHMVCKLSSLGHEEINIVGNTIMAQKFSETCEVASLKWKFKNIHWMDPETGFLWRTRQWISPRHKAPIEIEVLRPAVMDTNWQIHSAISIAN